VSGALLKGAALQPGDTIGIVAPSSGFDEAALERGIARLESLGYKVKLGDAIHRRSPQYFAGTPEQRVADLHAMFCDSAVRLILCTRGGYGSQALLPQLDLELIQKNPKPILGCSDLTAMQCWMLDQIGLVSFHGPMAAGDFAREDGLELASLNDCFSGKSEWRLNESSGLQTLKNGAAQGRLYGGCLSLLVSSLATRYELKPQQDSVLFIEDIGEKPYQIERMLTQWRAAGKLDCVKGVIFGEMLNCEQPGGGYTLRDVLQRVLADFPGPVGYGLRSGHVSRANVTLPLGVQCELVCGASATLTIVEPATRS